MLQEEINKDILGRQDQGGGLRKNLGWEKIKGRSFKISQMLFRM
jgi:hypothetical protein